MGYRKLGLEKIKMPTPDKGYFPNKDFDDIPDGGSPSCNQIYWNRSELRPVPGTTDVTTTAETSSDGAFYVEFEGVGKRTFICNGKLFEDVDGNLTNRTGAVTITSGSLVQAINHQQGSNKYAIYVNGTDAPWKWTGSGNAAVLGGSPQIFSCVSKHHNIIFGSKDETIYFSDVGDPETWDATNWTIPFEKTVIAHVDNSSSLAVMKENSIGSIQGYSYLDFTKEEKIISEFGCVGRLAFTKCVYKGTPVIAVVSKIGVYVFDAAYNFQKILGGDYFLEFNQEELSGSIIVYDQFEKLLYVFLPYGSAVTNNYFILINTETGAFWPSGPFTEDGEQFDFQSVAPMKDDSEVQWIYFFDTSVFTGTAGFVGRFNKDESVFLRGDDPPVRILPTWASKKFDLGDIFSFREAKLLADADGDYDVDCYLTFGLSASSSNFASVNLLGTGDLFGSTFILGASTLGGSNYVFKTVSGVSGFGRYYEVKFVGQTTGTPIFGIKSFEMLVKRRRLGSGLD